MTDPIKQQRAEFRNHFKQELKELKRMGKNPNEVSLLNGPDKLTQEITAVMEALANPEENITVGNHTYNKSDLQRRDLKPLMKLATKFFSTRREGLLTMDLLDSLHGLKRSAACLYVNEALETLTMNNEPIQNGNGDKTVQAINETIAQAKNNIKKYKKQLIVSQIIAGVGFLAVFAVIPAIILGGIIGMPIIMLFGAVAIGIGLKRAASCAEKFRAAETSRQFWPYALTFRETKEFIEYQKLFNQTQIDTNSMAFLEAAALTHKKIACKITEVKYINEFRDDLQLTKAEEKIGAGFKEINRTYLASKGIEMYEAKN